MPDTHQSDQRSAAGQQKPLSRKAAVAEAKRRHAAAVAALSAVGPAPLPILDARVSAKIAYYRPQGFDPRLWDQIAAVCRDLARYYAPRNGSTAVNVLWHLCRFTGWAAHQPHRADTSAPLRLDELDAPGLLERHLEAATGSPASLASRRSIVNRALLHSKGGHRVVGPRAQPAAVPHSGAEVALLIQHAHYQRTPTIRRAMCFIVGLSLGAGLDAHDLALVRRRDFQVLPVPGGDVLTVHVAREGSDRTVVVAEVMRPTVELAIALHDTANRGPNSFIVGTANRHDGVVYGYIAKAKAATRQNHVKVDTRRMRNTWLVGAMEANIPIRDILTSAGLVYATTLLRLLPYCTPKDPRYIAELFANVHKNWEWATR